MVCHATCHFFYYLNFYIRPKQGQGFFYMQTQTKPSVPSLFQINVMSSDDFCPIFIGNPIFWIQETDHSNGVPILCQIAFSSLSFPFFSGWDCFNGLVRNLNLECAWRQSYYSIKRIINPAFLSQCGHSWTLRRAAQTGSARKRNQLTRHVDISTIQ